MKFSGFILFSRCCETFIFEYRTDYFLIYELYLYNIEISGNVVFVKSVSFVLTNDSFEYSVCSLNPVESQKYHQCHQNIQNKGQHLKKMFFE